MRHSGLRRCGTEASVISDLMSWAAWYNSFTLSQSAISNEGCSQDTLSGSSGVAPVGRVGDIVNGYGARVQKSGYSAIVWLMEHHFITEMLIQSKFESLSCITIYIHLLFVHLYLPITVDISNAFPPSRSVEIIIFCHFWNATSMGRE